jgi:hypothetical protein
MYSLQYMFVGGMFAVFLLTENTMGMNRLKIHHIASLCIQLSLSGASWVRKPL